MSGVTFSDLQLRDGHQNTVKPSDPNEMVQAWKACLSGPGVMQVLTKLVTSYFPPSPKEGLGCSLKFTDNGMTATNKSNGQAKTWTFRELTDSGMSIAAPLITLMSRINAICQKSLPKPPAPSLPPAAPALATLPPPMAAISTLGASAGTQALPLPAPKAVSAPFPSAAGLSPLDPLFPHSQLAAKAPLPPLAPTAVAAAQAPQQPQTTFKSHSHVKAPADVPLPTFRSFKFPQIPANLMASVSRQVNALSNDPVARATQVKALQSELAHLIMVCEQTICKLRCLLNSYTAKKDSSPKASAAMHAALSGLVAMRDALFAHIDPANRAFFEEVKRQRYDNLPHSVSQLVPGYDTHCSSMKDSAALDQELDGICAQVKDMQLILETFRTKMGIPVPAAVVKPTPTPMEAAGAARSAPAGLPVVVVSRSDLTAALKENLDEIHAFLPILDLKRKQIAKQIQLVRAQDKVSPNVSAVSVDLIFQLKTQEQALTAIEDNYAHVLQSLPTNRRARSLLSALEDQKRDAVQLRNEMNFPAQIVARDAHTLVESIRAELAVLNLEMSNKTRNISPPPHLAKLWMILTVPLANLPFTGVSGQQYHTVPLAKPQSHQAAAPRPAQAKTSPAPVFVAPEAHEEGTVVVNVNAAPSALPNPVVSAAAKPAAAPLPPPALKAARVTALPHTAEYPGVEFHELASYISARLHSESWLPALKATKLLILKCQQHKLKLQYIMEEHAKFCQANGVIAFGSPIQKKILATIEAWSAIEKNFVAFLETAKATFAKDPGVSQQLDDMLASIRAIQKDNYQENPEDAIDKVLPGFKAQFQANKSADGYVNSHIEELRGEFDKAGTILKQLRTQVKAFGMRAAFVEPVAVQAAQPLAVTAIAAGAVAAASEASDFMIKEIPEILLTTKDKLPLMYKFKERLLLQLHLNPKDETAQRQLARFQQNMQMKLQEIAQHAAAHPQRASEIQRSLTRTNNLNGQHYVNALVLAGEKPAERLAVLNNEISAIQEKIKAVKDTQLLNELDNA